MTQKPLHWLSALLLTVPLVGACGDDGGDNNPPDVDAMPGTPDADPGTGTPDANLGVVDCFDEKTFFEDSGRENLFGTDPELADPNSIDAPNFAPAADSAVFTGGATPPDDGFFDVAATFIGAIGTEDWTAGWTSYPLNTTDPNPASADVVEKSGDIDADETWTSDNVYLLTDKVFVNAVLTIEAGTLVRGQDGSALVVTPAGSISAVGTADEPIVFTSENETGATTGDWGGVVLIGEASINTASGTDVVEGFDASEADKVGYGGTEDDGSCGTLSYVRIEYAGFAISQGNELNGLTVAGCGSGTELDFVQIHRGLDDGVEFFGGTANVKHLVVSLPADDALDCDQGWRGKGQFIIVQQDGNNGDRAIECDNSGDDADASPRTKPSLWNLTLVGSKSYSGESQLGMKLKNGFSGTIRNAIVAFFRSAAIDVDGAPARAQAEAGDLTVTNSIFFQNGAADVAGWPDAFEADTADPDNLPNDCVITTS
ncbi:MAG: hypothetical protein Tsb0020_24950 [Haliangiales bacterium]